MCLRASVHRHPHSRMWIYPPHVQKKRWKKWKKERKKMKSRSFPALTPLSRLGKYRLIPERDNEALTSSYCDGDEAKRPCVVQDFMLFHFYQFCQFVEDVEGEKGGWDKDILIRWLFVAFWMVGIGVFVVFVSVGDFVNVIDLFPSLFIYIIYDYHCTVIIKLFSLYCISWDSGS